MTPPRCESGTCLQVEVTGESTELWETMQPDIRVVTTTASWQGFLDRARAEERARIVAWLRGASEHLDEYDSLYIADLIETRLVDDLVAGDE